MTIEVLADVILSERVIMAGVTGSLTRQNARGVNQAGFATANVVRDETIRQYEIGTKPMKTAYWAEIEGIYEITDAGAFGFLMLDPKDQVVTVGGLQGYMLGVEYGVAGYGNGGPLYGLRQLKKAASSTRTKARVVTRPKDAPAMLRGGTPVVVGAGAGQVAVSTAPVYITFQPDATRTLDSVTVGATTQVNLSSAIPGLVVGGRLWLQGLTGTDAALLNNMSHEITNIASDVYTLATNTAGKTITAAGAAHKYPQPDETLSWTGTFYVPVQFAEDEMNWDMARPGHFDDRLVAGNSIRLLEIREA